MRRIRIGLAVFSLVILLIIAAQNTDAVELQFLGWSASLSLVLLVFLAAGAGFILGFVVGKLGGGASKGPRN